MKLLMNHSNTTSDLIQVLSYSVGSVLLSQVNSVMGLVSLGLSITFTGYKLYTEIKNNKNK